MIASAALADSLLGTHCSQIAMGPGLAAGVLATRFLNVLFHGRLGTSRLRVGAPIALSPAMGPTQRDARVPVARSSQRVERDEPS
jgi:hypothetical protein